MLSKRESESAERKKYHMSKWLIQSPSPRLPLRQTEQNEKIELDNGEVIKKKKGGGQFRDLERGMVSAEYR